MTSLSTSGSSGPGSSGAALSASAAGGSDTTLPPPSPQPAATTSPTQARPNANLTTPTLVRSVRDEDQQPLKVSLTLEVPSLTVTREVKSFEPPANVVRNWISESPDDELVTVTDVLPIEPS